MRHHYFLFPISSLCAPDPGLLDGLLGNVLKPIGNIVQSIGNNNENIVQSIGNNNEITFDPIPALPAPSTTAVGPIIQQVSQQVGPPLQAPAQPPNPPPQIAQKSNSQPQPNTPQIVDQKIAPDTKPAIPKPPPANNDNSSDSVAQPESAKTSNLVSEEQVDDAKNAVNSLVPYIAKECASILKPALSATSGACGGPLLDIATQYLMGNGTLSSSVKAIIAGDLLANMCEGTCSSALQVLFTVLMANECSVQIISEAKKLLAPRFGSLVKVFASVACTKVDDLYCLPRQVGQFQQFLTSRKGDDSEVFDLLVTATNMTCSKCGLKQQESIVTLPITNLTWGVKEEIVFVIGQVQKSCEDTAPAHGRISKLSSGSISIHWHLDVLFKLGVGFFLL